MAVIRRLFLEEMWFQSFFAFAVAVALFLLKQFGVWDVCQFVTVREPSGIHGTLASIYGSLLGFVITAAAIVISALGSPTLAIVRKSVHFPKLWKIFFSTSKFLGVATIFSLVCMIDSFRESLGALVTYFLIALGTGSALKVISCLWVLERVVELQQRTE